jgi:integrase
MPNKIQQRKGDGWVIPNVKCKQTGEIKPGNTIYVLGTVDGKSYRKSTGKKATAMNIAWIKKNAHKVLLQLIDKPKVKKKLDLESYGLSVLESNKSKRNRTSQSEVIGRFHKWILPYFKSYGLEDIKTTDINKWQNGLLEKLSTSYVVKCRNVLGEILNAAAGEDLVIKNYVTYANPIQVITQKRVPYSENEVTKILKISSGWFNAFLHTIFSTGVRSGEAIALMWRDINFDQNFIDLDRSISKGLVTTKDGNVGLDQYIKDGYKIIKKNNTNKTKNHTRIIPISNILKKVLMDLYKNRTNDIWVFPNSYNKPFTDIKNVNKNYWKPLLSDLNIQDKDLYTSRHTYATIMINNGTRSEFVKEVGGWKQDSRVMEKNYYEFKIQDQDIDAANNFHYEITKKKAE